MAGLISALNYEKTFVVVTSGGFRVHSDWISMSQKYFQGVVAPLLLGEENPFLLQRNEPNSVSSTNFFCGNKVFYFDPVKQMMATKSPLLCRKLQ